MKEQEILKNLIGKFYLLMYLRTKWQNCFIPEKFTDVR